MGNCASSLGRLEAALSSFERAVAAKEKGDVYGRIDYESISLSLRAGADRFRQLGRLEEAKACEEKAAALEAKLG